jgi:hypothetical protein
VLASSPIIVTGLNVPVALTLPGLLVTVYVDIGNVPVGPVNATDAAVSAIVVATIELGGPGNVFAVVDAEGKDVPFTLVAVKLNVYAVLELRPLATIVVEGEVAVPYDVPPETMLYVVPIEAPTEPVNENVAVVSLLDTKVRPVGAARTVVALKSDEVVIPAEFIALILNV